MLPAQAHTLVRTAVPAGVLSRTVLPFCSNPRYSDNYVITTNSAGTVPATLKTRLLQQHFVRYDNNRNGVHGRKTSTFVDQSVAASFICIVCCSVLYASCSVLMHVKAVDIRSGACLELSPDGGHAYTAVPAGMTSNEAPTLPKV